jgi:hypothetical protein
VGVTVPEQEQLSVELHRLILQKGGDSQKEKEQKVDLDRRQLVVESVVEEWVWAQH